MEDLKFTQEEFDKIGKLLDIALPTGLVSGVESMLDLNEELHKGHKKCLILLEASKRLVKD